jgi:putative MATE family efflux protein
MQTISKESAFTKSAECAVKPGLKALGHVSVYTDLLRMILPLFLTTILISLVGLSDSFVSGTLGAVEQAAVGLASQGTFILFLISMALSTGATAIVSRFWGAQDYGKAVISSRYILIGAALLGMTAAAAGSIGASQILQLMGAKAEVIKAGSVFMHLYLLGALPLTILWAVNALFRSMGQAKLSLFSWGFTASIAILGDFILVLGPAKMGLTGLALAWLSGTFGGLFISLFFLSRSPLGAALRGNEFCLVQLRYWLRRVLSIGLPASAQDGGYMLIRLYFFSLFSLMPAATSCQAAYSIGLRIENIVCVMPVVAMCLGATALVGQNLGAKNSMRAARVGWLTALLAFLLSVVLCVFMFLFSEQLASLISHDSQVIERCSQYLKYSGIIDPLWAVWFVLFSAMQGAGYTKVPMIAALGCLVGLRFPLSYFLGIQLGMGQDGCWISFLVDNFILCCIAIVLFKRGTWKLQVV